MLFFQNPSPAAPSSANSLFINCILLHSKTKVLRRTTKTLTFTHTQRNVCSRRERERRKTVNGRITPSTAAFSHYLQYLLCLSPVCYFSRVCLCSCMSVFCTSHSRSPTPDHFLCQEIRFTIPTHTHSHTFIYIFSFWLLLFYWLDSDYLIRC